MCSALNPKRGSSSVKLHLGNTADTTIPQAAPGRSPYGMALDVQNDGSETVGEKKTALHKRRRNVGARLVGVEILELGVSGGNC